MASAPTNETTMFKNRYEFRPNRRVQPVVADLGGRIRRFGSWVRLICETAFTKLLKRMPMAFVWGLRCGAEGGGRAGHGGAEGADIVHLEYGFRRRLRAAARAPMVNGFSSSSSSGRLDVHERTALRAWRPRSSSSSDAQHQLLDAPARERIANPTQQQHGTTRPNYSLDQSIGIRAEITYPTITSWGRIMSAAGPSSFAHGIPENYASSSPPPLTNGTSSSSSPITYPSFTPHARVRVRLALPPLPQPHWPSPPVAIASPPLAAINPTLSQRRSNSVDQSAEAVSSLLPGPAPPPPAPRDRLYLILRPPPAVASSALERQDRPREMSLCPLAARDWCWWKWER
ncbi:hypothetical protein B0H14DRAFT_3493450 [Mycena olivaceomarginata]|nr:hypothetical protein B0H14DRAFT_3493450 [Mycena olivaceomarginata]